MFSNFRGRRILVTGHTGFKGSWLALWLHRLGAQVWGAGLDPRTPRDAFYAMRIGDCCEDVRLDIRDFQAVSGLFQRADPEIVFHLAAQPLVLESYADPLSTYETNVLGTANILEAVRRTPSVRQAVLITTDKVYENREQLWGYRESDPLGGYDPYGTSKAAAEMVIAGYGRSFFHPDDYGRHKVGIASARAGNVVGGGDWAENRIVPDCIRALEEDEPVPVRNPGAVRPWQHVLEALGGYLFLSRKMEDDPSLSGQAWNFGPGFDGFRTVEALVENVIQVFGKGRWKAAKASTGKKESEILALDITKAGRVLGWKPILPFDKAVEWTVGWYRAFLNGENMRKYSLKQLQAYENIMKRDMDILQ